MRLIFNSTQIVIHTKSWKLYIAGFKRRNFMLLTAVITEAEEGGFIALNPETGTTTQGETYQEAIQNLKEATSLYLEEFKEAL